MTRILFTTDIHGSDRCFRKVVNAAKFYEVDALIVGGDLTGKMVIPLVKSANGRCICHLMGADLQVSTDSERQHLEKQIRDMGFYPYVTNPEEVAALSESPVLQGQLFERLIKDSLAGWIALADERLKGTGVLLFMQPGNDDFLFIDDLFSQSEHVVNPEGKVVSVGRYEMIGTGYANMTPWNCPRDVPDEDLARRIEVMLRQVQEMERCIFCFHAPPYGTPLDQAPQVGGNSHLASVGLFATAASWATVPAGSVAVRNVIEKYQPLLGLHGHVHGSRGVVHLGRTICINPGSHYAEGVLMGALVTLAKNKVASYQFISG